MGPFWDHRRGVLFWGCSPPDSRYRNATTF
jgi:hypothetical protein